MIYVQYTQAKKTEGILLVNPNLGGEARDMLEIGTHNPKGKRN
jgi:hypothetical protein